jgi:hypothetical protein
MEATQSEELADAYRFVLRSYISCLYDLLSRFRFRCNGMRMYRCLPGPVSSFPTLLCRFETF